MSKDASDPKKTEAEEQLKAMETVVRTCVEHWLEQLSGAAKHALSANDAVALVSILVTAMAMGLEE